LEVGQVVEDGRLGREQTLPEGMESNVIVEVSTDCWSIEDEVNAVGYEKIGSSDARELEELGGSEGSSREDDFFVDVEFVGAIRTEVEDADSVGFLGAVNENLDYSVVGE